MGYFDGLTAGAFKRDSQGRDLYFFWGKFGKGRVIPSEADGASVRTYLKNYYICVLVLIVPIVVFGRSEAFTAPWFLMLGGLIVAASLGLMPLYMRIRNWEIADERMTLAEAYSASAKAHGKGSMLFLVVLSSLLVACGLFVLVATDAKLVGALCVLFFGACLAVFVYMLRASRRG